MVFLYLNIMIWYQNSQYEIMIFAYLHILLLELKKKAMFWYLYDLNVPGQRNKRQR